MSVALLEEWVWAFRGATGHQQQTLSHAYLTFNHHPSLSPSFPASRTLIGVEIFFSPRDEL